jgi:hypothetical protein
MKALKTPIIVGSHYIDCGLVPRDCVEITHERYNKKTKCKNASIVGRSLVDGTEGICSLAYCTPMKVDKIIAQRWAKTGPLNPEDKLRLKLFYSSDHSEWADDRKIWWEK